MERFLIINPFGIGDVLFTTPVINALKEKYPDSFIGYWCNERTKDLLKNDSRIDRIFALSRGDIKRICRGKPVKGFLALLGLLKEIRKERFKIAFDFSLDSRYGLWSKLTGIRKRIGFDYKGRGRFLTDKIDLKGYSGRHVVEYYLDLLKLADPYWRAPLRVPYTMEGSKENSAKANDLLIGIAMGGGESWGKDASYKQWPAEKFGQLAEKLIDEMHVKVVLLGSVDERRLAEKIISVSLRGREAPEAISKSGIASSPSAPRNDAGHIVDLTGKLNLEELAAIIKELKLLICNDGGPLHMAVALGVSTVSIFGPVDERVYGPYPPSEKHLVVKKDLPCRPCYENFRFKGCFNNKRCLEDIDVDEVYGKVRSLL